MRNAGISLELNMCLYGFMIANMVILKITENNLFHLSIIAASTTPSAINPIAVPVENRSNDKDVDSLKPQVLSFDYSSYNFQARIAARQE